MGCSCTAVLRYRLMWVLPLRKDRTHETWYRSCPIVLFKKGVGPFQTVTFSVSMSILAGCTTSCVVYIHAYIIYPRWWKSDSTTWITNEKFSYQGDIPLKQKPITPWKTGACTLPETNMTSHLSPWMRWNTILSFLRPGLFWEAMSCYFQGVFHRFSSPQARGASADLGQKNNWYNTHSFEKSEWLSDSIWDFRW